MLITYLLLLSALGLSTIAGYYSVIGMTAIFAAAWWPVVIMTGMLEFSKVIVASWLYRNWKITPMFLKTYLTAAVVILMFITSLGIFGYLSKAHIDQGLDLGDNGLRIAQINQQIDVERARIADNRKIQAQMDDAVNAILTNSISANAQKANRGGNMATQAAKLRDSQKKERDALNRSINESNEKIRDLSTQKLKLDQSQLKLEAEVGPIKYIAQMIYGDNPDKNLLERAVRWVTILIIFVFDPLAVLMIIAANMSMVVNTKSKIKREDVEELEPKKPSEPMANASDASKSDGEHGFTWVEPNVSAVPAGIPLFHPRAEESTQSIKSEEVEFPPVIPEPAPPRSSEPEANEPIDAGPQEVTEPEANEPIDAGPQEVTEPEIQGSNPIEERSAIVVSDEMPMADVDPIENSDPSQPEPTVIKKPDDILQTIKQYHTVRLDDATRTMR